MTADTRRVAPSRAASPTVHTVRQLAAALLVMGAWFWSIALVVIVLANVVGWVAAGATDVSIAIYARQASVWFPFSLGIMFATTYLRVHVAAGMTRRTFVRAALVVEVGAGVAYAVVLTTLVLLERAVHDALGWRSEITEIQLTDETSSAWMLLLELAAVFVLGNLTGLLVGTVYQVGGAWWGTLTLPLTVGPLVAVLYLAGSLLLDLPGLWTTTVTSTLGVMVGASVVLALLVSAVVALLTRRAPLSART